jgi:hypothetical protein
MNQMYSTRPNLYKLNSHLLEAFAWEILAL